MTKQLIDSVLKDGVAKYPVGDYDGFKGEVNLKIDPTTLLEVVLSVNHYRAFVGEFTLLVRQGLIDRDGELFLIPDWDKFIWAVDAYYKTCYAEED